jgi:hypothetical protein
MLAKKYLLSLRPRLFTSRRERTSRGLFARKHQGNQLQLPSRCSPRLPERHRPLTNRLVLLCRYPRLLKHLRPSIESSVRSASSVPPRNTEEGGSLTTIATVLTGRRDGDREGEAACGTRPRQLSDNSLAIASRAAKRSRVSHQHYHRRSCCR